MPPELVLEKAAWFGLAERLAGGHPEQQHDQDQ
jgi:hypothetical protein